MLVEDWQVGLVAVAEVQLVELMNSISLREEVGVGVAEHAAVVPYGGAPLAAGALLGDVLGGGRHRGSTVLAFVGEGVSSAQREAVDLVRGLTHRAVVESCSDGVRGGGGGEIVEEDIEFARNALLAV